MAKKCYKLELKKKIFYNETTIHYVSILKAKKWEGGRGESMQP